MKTSDLIDQDETAPTSAAPPQAERSVSESSPVRLTKTPPPSEKIARLRALLATGAYVADHVMIARRVLEMDDLDGDEAGTSALAEHAAEGEPKSGTYPSRAVG